MTLSQALAYTVDHLTEAADHWARVADHRESTFAEVRNQAYRIDWTGTGADGMHEHVEQDFQEAVTSSDYLRKAESIARTGAGDLDSLHRRLLHNLEDVRNDGFVVKEDYTALNSRPTKSLEEFLARQQLGVQHTADLRLKATDLTESDARVGAQLQTATAGEGKVQFVDHTFKTEPKIEPVDRTWKQDPPPPPQPSMSRKQAADGLKDVNDRIWTHNHVDKPVIDALPPNDPRRTDFHIETERLNAEKRQYLDVLPQQHPPANVIGPNGANLPGVPPGVISNTAAKSGQGWIYPVTPQPGIDPRVVSIRVMEPTPQYPNGYLNYLNIDNQEVDPFTGRTVPPTNPYAHIPLPKR